MAAGGRAQQPSLGYVAVEKVNNFAFEYDGKATPHYSRNQRIEQHEGLQGRVAPYGTMHGERSKSWLVWTWSVRGQTSASSTKLHLTPQPHKSFFQRAIKSRESEHMSSSASTQQEGHDRSQVPSTQRARDHCLSATLLCRSRDFVKSSAERAHRWTRDAHRARGIAWTLFMRQERGPRLDMELVDGSGKGVGEEESGRRRGTLFLPRGTLFPP